MSYKNKISNVDTTLRNFCWVGVVGLLNKLSKRKKKNKKKTTLKKLE